MAPYVLPGLRELVEKSGKPLAFYAVTEQELAGMERKGYRLAALRHLSNIRSGSRFRRFHEIIFCEKTRKGKLVTADFPQDNKTRKTIQRLLEHCQQ